MQLEDEARSSGHFPGRGPPFQFIWFWRIPLFWILKATQLVSLMHI